MEDEAFEDLTVEEKRKRLANMSDEEKKRLLEAIDNDELPSREVEDED